MKEKKQTNRLSYSKFGKLFRGFLCMLTFGVFCASLILTIYAVSWYGDRIVYEPAAHYTDTDLYQMEVTDTIHEILYNVSLIDESEVPEDKLAILNVPKMAIYYYDIKAIYNDGFSPDNLSDLSGYEKQEPLEVEDITDYEQMKEYLLADDVPFEYIYFDEKSFVKLFERDGLKNTDYRFSKDFPQDAYFIFENYEMTQKQAVSKTEDTTESTEENTVGEVSSEAAIEATTEEVGKEENTEETSEISEAVETEEVIMTPYSLTSYAVYEPYEELFYSTWDDYFSDITSYLYQVEELRSLVKEAEEDGTHYNSIVIPLLKSHNQFPGEMIQEASIPYSNISEAKENLAYRAEEGIYFCVTTGDSVKHSNGKNGQEIEKMKRFYRFEKLADGTIKQTHSNNLKDLDSLDAITDTLMSYPSDAILWVGLQSEGDMYGLAQRVEGYYWFASNTWILVIVAVVSFVLLMVQAGWLIYTTGRRYKGDTEVSLAFFDCWYTDIWALVTVMILIGCMIVGFLTLEAVNFASTKEMMAFLTAIGMLPFGFCFMVLTLSFARRIKARNIWNHFLIVRFVKYVDRKIKNGQQDSGQEENRKSSVIVEKLSQIWGRCKEAYYNIKGTRKLLIIFVIYLFAEIAIVVVMMDDEVRGQCMLAFCALQIIALFLVVRVVKDIDKLTDGVKKITQGDLDSKVEINEKISVFDDLANGINHIGDGLKNAVETSLKDERMKTELITNVSHDLKTPLTSIINYVNLLKKQEMPSEDAKHYVEVLDGKAQRLKQLTEDLVEAAKATSGNIELEMMPLTFDELMKQALGEFEDKFEKRNLTIIARYPEKPAVVMADGRRLFRVIENVLQNIYKYAMEGTRVYADLTRDGDKIVFTLKNVSAAPLNISPDELMERFTRGDSSRTTEGSGLGLSIAKDLTRLQNGEFEIQLDGDLFKVIIRFPEHK